MANFLNKRLRYLKGILNLSTLGREIVNKFKGHDVD